MPYVFQDKCVYICFCIISRICNGSWTSFPWKTINWFSCLDNSMTVDPLPTQGTIGLILPVLFRLHHQRPFFIFYSLHFLISRSLLKESVLMIYVESPSFWKKAALISAFVTFKGSSLHRLIFFIFHKLAVLGHSLLFPIVAVMSDVPRIKHGASIDWEDYWHPPPLGFLIRIQLSSVTRPPPTRTFHANEEMTQNLLQLENMDT